jgi:hypothetical protein
MAVPMTVIKNGCQSICLRVVFFSILSVIMSVTKIALITDNSLPLPQPLATAVSSCGASYAAASVNVKKSGGQAVT